MKQPNKITTNGNNSHIHIKSSNYGNINVLIDTEDVDKVKDYKWSIGFTSKKYYVMSHDHVNNKTIYLHRLLLNFPETLVDHRNGDTFNNKKKNLRSFETKLEGFSVNRTNRTVSKRYQKFIEKQEFIDITINNLADWLL